VETFGPPKEFVEDPGFAQARIVALSELELAEVDAPIIDLVSAFAEMPHCFTLQSCHGHFVCEPGDRPDNNAPIPAGQTGEVRYRIAYVAMCIEPSDRGRALHDALSSITKIDPAYVQFGSPDWFWDRRVNSYALQVEPGPHRLHDEVRLAAEEARHVESIRGLFFQELRALVASEARAGRAG